MPESIGQRLKKEREARYLTLEKASEVTRIRTVFLQALEAATAPASATEGTTTATLGVVTGFPASLTVGFFSLHDSNASGNVSDEASIRNRGLDLMVGSFAELAKKYNAADRSTK